MSFGRFRGIRLCGNWAWSLTLVALLIPAIVIAAEPKARSQAEKEEPAGPNEKPILGLWQIDTLSLSSGENIRERVEDQKKAYNAQINSDVLMLRVGKTVFGELKYDLHTNSRPWTIDVSSKDGKMLGICEHDGNQLKIALNDADKSRSSDFRNDKNDLVLLLSRPRTMSILVLDADGRNLRHLPNFDGTTIGSPEWSHDGQRLAFDGWRPALGENNRDSHIFICNVDGSGLKDLGPGCMPSWSPDDKRLTYVQYFGQDHVWIRDVDGANPELICSDAWCSQWSPVRNEIAYTKFRDNLYVYNADTKQTRELLHGQYVAVHWGMSWSPDGKWICFRGRRPDGRAETVAVHAEGDEKGFKVLIPTDAMPDIKAAGMTSSWGGNGNQIVATIIRKSQPVPKPYIFDFTGKAPPMPFPGFPADWLSGDIAWSSDGKRIAITGQRVEGEKSAAATGGSAS